MRTRWLVPAALVAAGLLTSCSSTHVIRTTAATEPRRPWTRARRLGSRHVTDDADHFSIDLPSAWKVESLSSPNVSTVLKQLETENPKLAVIGDPSTLASGERSSWPSIRRWPSRPSP